MIATNEWVELSLDLTINLGNYESAKVHVGRGTAIREGETEDEAYQRLDDFVTDKVMKEVAEARKAAK